ncbi:MAG: hypothetical protein F4X19_15270 [Acidobacteria bacterium]|nr:hypothetical protein [Acidobacteriota bacterium]
MQVLVSDTSVLVDLERGSLLEASFRLPHRFAVPDLLYERELKDWGGSELIRLGLSVEGLDGNGVKRAIAYRRREPALSLADCFALTLAKTRAWVLLSGDRTLRQLAAEETVECHGVLWLLDQMYNASVVSIPQLHAGLTAISKHPRCRLPKAEIRRRLAQYADRLR